MTNNNAELLLKDLSARVKYGVVILDTAANKQGIMCTISKLGDIQYDCEETDEWLRQSICGVKPYLRPMSSMTEEEMNEYNEVWDLDRQDVFLKAKEYQENYLGKYPNSIYENPLIPWYRHIDWLNAHHFDYHGLIDKGLALEAPEGMYN